MPRRLVPNPAAVMSNADCRFDHGWVGDPINVVTGVNASIQFEFALTGPVPLLWRRHYDSSRCGLAFSLGWGHAHEYDRWLQYDLDGLRYTGPLGASVGLPAVERGAAVSAAGLTIRRTDDATFRISAPGEPAMEFRRGEATRRWPISALVRGDDRVEFTYDAQARLTAIRDASGRYIRVDSDPSGVVQRLTWARAPHAADRVLIDYQYDERGNLVQGTDAYGNGFSLGWDSANRLIRTTDRNGYSFHFAYDAEGRCIQSMGEDGVLGVRLDYRPHCTVVTRVNGGEWMYGYDDAGFITQIVDPYGVATRFEPDEHGRVSRHVDPLGNATEWVYSESGTFLGTRSPIGSFVPAGEKRTGPDRVDHPLPATPLEWEYGNLVPAAAIRPPRTGSPVLSDLPGTVASLVRTSGGTSASGEPQSFDSAGRLVFRRDELGRKVRVDYPDGTMRRWTYDANGNIARFVDRGGSAFGYTFRSWNHLRSETDPLERSTSFEWDRHENLIGLQDPGGATTRYVYDLKDRLTEVWRDDTLKERYEYDVADNLIARLDAEGEPLVTLKIGPGNQVAERRLRGGQTQRFEYDASGRYTMAATDSSVIEFAYDDEGQRIADKRDGLGVEHAFDGAWWTATAILGRFTVTCDHESGDRITIVDPTGGAHRIRHLGDGLVLRVLANGSRELSQFDGAGRCLLKAAFRERGTPVWSRRFTYAPEGELLRVQNNLRGDVSYAYDAIHRLVRAETAGGPVERFHYDRGGNLLAQPGLADVGIGPGNRLAFANGRAATYDTRFHLAALEGPQDSVRYRYDARGFLTGCSSGDGEWSASYDALGRLIETRSGDRAVTYHWDSDRLAAEVHSTGRVRVYVYAAPQALVPFLFVEYASIGAPVESGQRYYLFGDQLGTPLRVEDDLGDVVWSARIRPYGEALIDPESSIELNLRFPGHYYDPALGLHYNRFRHYDPVLGRYLQSDPAGITGGFNLYAYPANPLGTVDLRGQACPAHLVGHNPNCEDCQDDEPTQVRGRPPQAPDPDTTERCGPPGLPAPFLADRPAERPYRRPPEMYVAAPGHPIDTALLNPHQSPYLWVVDQHGNVLIAPDQQGGYNRPVKHRDLTAQPDGSPGPGRAGGELRYDRNTDTWTMNNESSYTFCREDGYHGTGDNLNASHDLLTQSGSDTSRIIPDNSDGVDAPGRR